jgi:hypothetical protein
MSDVVKSRYNFNGFTFGRDGDFNLVIEVKTSEFGYLTQYGLELTPAERQELITVLIKGSTTKEAN